MGLLTELPHPPEGKTGWPWSIETSPDCYNSEVNYPKVSIITPSYNQGEYIEETIRSVLLQNYPNLEYIVIDGGSTDNTRKILDKYSPWITYWVSEKDNGQSHAINKGLKKATGDIFNWINSDDQLWPGALEQVARGFLEDDIDVYSGKQLSTREGFWKVGKENNLSDRLSEMIWGFYICQTSTFWRVKSLSGILPLSQDLNYCMDLEMWIQYLLKFGQEKINKYPFVLSIFRFHDDSKTVAEKHGFKQDGRKLTLQILHSFGLPESLLNKCQKKWNLKNWDTEKHYEINRSLPKIYEVMDVGLIHVTNQCNTFSWTERFWIWVKAIQIFPRRSLRSYVKITVRLLFPLYL